jgi:hypothetical protein
VLVILAAIGVYFMAFRSLPTTVSWTPSASAITPGSDLTVSGRITPAEGGRHLSLQSASSASGSWQAVPQSATTDSRGRFTLTFKPQLSGSIVLRVVVDPAGRYLKVTSQAKSVRPLSLSRLSLKGGGLITNRSPVNFTVVVDPSGAGRTVWIEQSTDKVHWVPVGLSAQTKAFGTLVVNVPAPAVGVWSYRAKVAQDDKYAAVVSPLVGLRVEDILVTTSKAAAAYAGDLSHAVAVAEQARQQKARAEHEAAQAAADSRAAKDAASARQAPQYGYQCMPGDEKHYSVCASHKAWIDGQIEYDNCISSGRTWDIAAQKCR